MTKFSGSELPEAAKEKLLSFDAARVEAEDAARSARARINGMGRDADPRIVEKLQQAAERHRRRHDDLHALTASVRQWLSGLPPGVALETQAAAGAKPQKGQTVGQAVSRLRDEITADEKPPVDREGRAAATRRHENDRRHACSAAGAARRPKVSLIANALTSLSLIRGAPTAPPFLDIAAFAARLAPDLWWRAWRKRSTRCRQNSKRPCQRGTRAARRRVWRRRCSSWNGKRK